MFRDLFFLKARLNCDLLTVGVGAKTVTTTAEREGLDGRRERMRKQLSLEELLAIRKDLVEAVLVQMVDGVGLECG